MKTAGFIVVADQCIFTYWTFGSTLSLYSSRNRQPTKGREPSNGRAYGVHNFADAHMLELAWSNNLLVIF